MFINEDRFFWNWNFNIFKLIKNYIYDYRFINEIIVFYVKEYVKINRREKYFYGNFVYWWFIETSLGGGVRGIGCVLCKINKNVI